MFTQATRLRARPLTTPKDHVRLPASVPPARRPARRSTDVAGRAGTRRPVGRGSCVTLLHRIEGIIARNAVRLLRTIGPVRSSAALRCDRPRHRPAAPRLEGGRPQSPPRHARVGPSSPAKRIVRGVWDNLGRTAGEFPHVGTLTETTSGPGWEVVGAEHIEALAARGGPAVLFTGHIGNWEVLPLATARRGVQFATVYRTSDNPEIDALILELRRASAGANEKLFPKGTQGARQTLAPSAAGRGSSVSAAGPEDE